MKKHLLLFSFLCSSLLGLAQGKVGIGTNSPTEKLHVQGNLKADTVKSNVLKIAANAGTGKVLTSDAGGNASWKAATTTAGSTGNVGFGSWGDCSMNNISEYNPVADSLPKSNAYFGTSVAISSNFAIVGAPATYHSSARKGSASIFYFNGTNWEFKQTLTNPSGVIGDEFGASVDIRGNWAVVGARYDNIGTNLDQGSAFLYFYNGSTWVFKQKLVDPTGAPQDLFGTSVAIHDGRLIVGSPGDDANKGSAFVYHLNNTTWNLFQKLTDASGAQGDRFGSSVDIWGDKAIISAPDDDINTFIDRGSASVFQYDEMSLYWYPKKKIFVESSGSARDYFGSSVAINNDYAAIGVPEYSFQGKAPGAAFMYSLGENVVLIDAIVLPNDGQTSRVGHSVSLDDNYLLIGAMGAALISTRLGMGWQLFQKIKDPGGGTYLFTGAIFAKRFIIGDPTYTLGSGKAMFGKVN